MSEDATIRYAETPDGRRYQHIKQNCLDGTVTVVFRGFMALVDGTDENRVEIYLPGHIAEQFGLIPAGATEEQ